jgi:hypothetical protein
MTAESRTDKGGFDFGEAEAFRRVELITGDDERAGVNLKQALAKLLDSYRGYGGILFVPEAVSGVARPGIVGNLEATQRVIEILTEVSPPKLIDRFSIKYNLSPQRVFDKIESPIASFGQQLAQVVAIMAERIESYQTILSSAECLKRYVPSKNFSLLVDLFRLLSFRLCPDEIFSNSYNYNDQTIQGIARKLGSDEMINRVIRIDPRQLHDWIYDGQSLEDKPVRTHYLNVPTPRSWIEFLTGNSEL